MKKILKIMCIMVVSVMIFTGCGNDKKEATNEEEITKKEQSLTDNEKTSTNKNPQLTNIAEYDNRTLELGEAIKTTDDEGNTVLRVKAIFTNNTNEPIYAYSCFNLRAFQDNMEIEDISDINGDDKSLTVAVKDGQKIEVSYTYKLVSDKEVEVLIGTPTFDEQTIGKKVYSLK